MIHELIGMIKRWWCIRNHQAHQNRYPISYNGESAYHCRKCGSEFIR